MFLQKYAFPPDFLWGAATSCYQIEGAVNEDGRGKSVWDTLCERPGAIRDGSSGQRACDHYHLLEQDLDMLKDLGLNAYRFSIAWPRIIPQGRGAVENRGLDFYERMVDGLLKRGIQPNATLYHWDLPQTLEDQDGWLNRDTALAFVDYSLAVAKRLGDRIGMWTTFNEPEMFTWLGYELGVHAPGRKETRAKTLQAIHHVLLAHGLAVKALRDVLPKTAQIGITLTPRPILPNTDSPQDLAAAELYWQDSNDWWALPMLVGGYPEAALKRLGASAPQVQAGDDQIIKQPIDFLGLNYYAPSRIAATTDAPGYRDMPPPKDAPQQSMASWEIMPAGLEDLLIQYHKRYPKIALYVTENGITIPEDAVAADGKVHDPRRLAFVRDHLIHCQRAIAAGVDLRGYFAWTVMDNFEWAEGYQQRFGLVHVDFETLKRTPKDSYYWYQAACNAKGFEGPDLPALKTRFV